MKPPQNPPPTLDPGPLVEHIGDGVRGAARRLGVDPSLLCRPLTFAQADRFAIAVGKHPIDIWGPDVWWSND
jgi:hypothetical protein